MSFESVEQQIIKKLFHKIGMSVLLCILFFL